MSSIHRVGENLRNRNKAPKCRHLEKIDNYDIVRDGTMFRIDRSSAYLSYRSTQAEAHKLIAKDKIQQAAAISKAA